MQITSLQLKNFRQFYDPQMVTFAKNDQNVTLIIGVNGAGKTGIFRAIRFGLFGDEKLDQDNQSRHEAVHLVNLDRLRENDGDPVTAEVEVCFEHEGVMYQIHREKIEIADGDNIKELSSRATLSKRTSSGETEQISNNVEEVNSELNMIMPDYVRNFFFFDAEQSQLFPDSSNKAEVSEKIKNSVQNLLQIKSVQKAEDILKQLIKQQKNEIAHQSKDLQLNQIQSKKQSNLAEIDTVNNKLKEVSQELKLAGDEKNAIELEIANTEQLTSQKKQLNRYEEELINQDRLIDEISDNMKSLLFDGVSFLWNDTMNLVMPKVSIIQEQNDSKFDKRIIEMSLQRGSCLLCGNDLSDHPENEIHVKQLLDNYHQSNIRDVFQDIEIANEHVKENSEVTDLLKEKYKTLIEASKKKEQLMLQIDKMNESLSGHLAAIQNVEDKKVNSLPTINRKLDAINTQINELKFQLNNLESEQEQLDKDEKRQIDLVNEDMLKEKVFKRTERILDGLTRILHAYDSNMRTELSERILDMLKKLLSNIDRNLVQKLDISTTYDLTLLNDDDVNVLGDLSMGQKQALSLSFIFALADLSSRGRSDIDFPLLVDTPFARLDSIVRTNMIRETPKFARQWILLLTDTELGENEMNLFASEDKVSKIYRITKDQDGKSVIRAIDSFSELKEV